MSKKKNTLRIIKNIMLFLAGIIITGIIYIKRNYNLSTFEQIMLSLQLGTGGTGKAVIKDIFVKNILVLPSILLLLFLPEIIFNKKNRFNELEYKRYNVTSFIISICIFILSIIFLFSAMKFDKNFWNLLLKQTTNIYDKKYVMPQKIKIENKNEKKKNLIFIVSESLEASTVSKKNGGQFEKSVTPELEKLAMENINFSYTDKIGGFKMSPGATLTTGALATLNSGVGPIVNFDKFLEKPDDKYMPGAYSIGQVLKKEGYSNSFILGSDANFGKRRQFYESHGVKEIIDLYKAREMGYIPPNYHDGWWGYEDAKLFEIAKKEISKKAKDEKPFFTTLLTVDTHFPEGQLPSGYKLEFDRPYLDVYRNQSKMIGEFIDWLKKQEFYEDTVIVITGDHLTMRKSFFEEGPRYVYNVIINSNIDSDKSRIKNRKFVTEDMTPTILSALGYNIKGDRFGMGTNLFSDKKTITEEIGYEKLTVELQKLSKFYNKNIAKEFDKENIDIEERLNRNYNYNYINNNHDEMKK